MRLRYNKNIKALLLSGAILAPALILAGLGIRAFRTEALLLKERYAQDQAAIVRLVADRLSDAAQKALEDLDSRLNLAEPDATVEERFRAAHPIARHIFYLSRGRLIYPPAPSQDSDSIYDDRIATTGYWYSDLDVQNYVSRLRESRKVTHSITQAITAESHGKLKQAITLLKRASESLVPESAQALLSLARIFRRQGKLEQSKQIYKKLKQRFGTRQDPEGVSYALLADAGLAEMGPPRVFLAMHQRLLKEGYNTSRNSRRFYLRWVIVRLTQARGVSEDKLRHLQRSTRHIFESEAFGAVLMRHGIFDLHSLAEETIGSLAMDRKTILVMQRKNERVVGYSIDEEYLRREVARQETEAVPLNRGIQLNLHRVGETPKWPQEQVIYTSLLESPLSNWTITALLVNKDPVEKIQGLGGLGRPALIIGLILILAIGLILTYYNVRRESELAQLKSDFASNVSHELKTPLTSIRMYAEMLLEGIAVTSNDQKRYQRVIIKESERLGRLIANVLDFSKVERGTRRYDLSSLDLKEMAQEAVETYRRLSEGEKIKIYFTPPANLAAEVIADREAAVQCILNLLSNAAKYSLKQEQEINVEIKNKEGRYGVTVEDHGIGIPSSELKRIFDDFYRAPDARRVGVEGTGLGLALVRRHMKSLGGAVEVESAPGKGSRFTLWFIAASKES